ncbi:hypothetical protein RHMOL_Rhmol04G0304000 [Rhododendron molle]|uniref:Uncharacterized protein n=1 Tax=Rhododendron molle TaxID=49168 RepID=A0ACC0P735_RHOML|nr:hypothetical protein RHMOL_Rhmol04G0304000 [Rhododendron molle]
MGFFSFLGRVLFASLFILSAWLMFNDFGTDGGPAAKELAPKLAVVEKYLTSKLGEGAPKIDVRHFVAASIFLKGLGGFLFVFGSSLGAYLLLYYLAFTTPLLYDFYNYNYGEPEFFALLQEFLQCIALFGALIFFLGMKYSIPRKQLKRKTPKTKTV